MSIDTETSSKGVRWLQLFVLLVLLAVFAVVIMLGRYQQFSDAPLDIPGRELLYHVQPGSSLNKLAHDLHTRNIIQYPRFFILLGRQMDVARRLQAGEYILRQGLTPRTLLEQLVEGKVNQYELALIEGHTFREMLQRIHADPVLVHTLPGDATDAVIMEILGQPGQHPEGRFLPDTYYFTRGMTDVDFLARAWQAMSDLLSIAWDGREEGLLFKSPYEAPAKGHAPADRSNRYLWHGRIIRRQHPQARFIKRHTLQHLYSRWPAADSHSHAGCRCDPRSAAPGEGQ